MDRLYKILAFILAFALIFTTASEIFASDFTDVDVKEKIEDLKDFDDDEFLDVIIKLKQEIDTDYIKRALSRENVGKSREEIQGEVIQEIVDESIRLANHSQSSILNILEDGKKNNIVKSFESFFIVNCINVVAKKSLLMAIAGRDEVKKIVLNKKIKIDKPERDLIEARNSVFMASTGTHVPWNLRAISAKQAQDEAYESKNEVVVGIIDSGVDSTHPAIKDNYRGNDKNLAKYSWYNTINGKDGSEETPFDDRGHGTHVCGTILGKKDGQLMGVNPSAKWIAVKVFDSDGETDNAKLLKAGEWIMAPGGDSKYAPKIVNNSWGGNSTDGFYQDIVKKWREAGIFPVFSAGNVGPFNDGGDDSIGTPASYPESYAVGAIRKDEHVAKFSLRGKSSYTDNFKPDIVAPGVNILSSVPGGKYEMYTGTSMAAPHVSGVVSLMLKVNPNLSVDQIEKILNETATPLKDEYYIDTPNHGYGHGKVNAYYAVRAAKGQEKGKDINKDNMGVLRGRLLSYGEDSENPVISHSPLKTIYTTYKTTFDMDVRDNVGIKSVKLYLNLENEKEYEVPLKRGNKVDGYYSINVPVSTFNGVTEGKYRIEATDINGHVTKTEDYSFTVENGVGIGYTQDFETDISGFDFGGEERLFKWGNIKSDEPGNKMIGIPPYKKPRGNAIVVMPPIDFTSETRSAALTFRHFYDLGNSNYAFNDQAEVWIAEAKEDSDPDNLEWKIKRSYRNHSTGWTEEYIDLSEYKGKKVCVMFGFRPNGEWSSEGQGWYIDDIKITEASKEVPEKPSKYLKLNNKKDGKVIYTFSPVDNEKITAYELWRATDLKGPFTLVKTAVKDDKNSGFGKYSIDLVDIPKPQKGSYYYYAVAKIGENSSEKSELKSVTFTKGEEFKSFNFEDGIQGWTTGNDGTAKWEYGTLEYGDQYNTKYRKPIEKQSLSKNDGMKMWATNMNDYRVANKEYELVSPVIDLSTLDNAHLYYQNWFGSSGKRYTDEWDTYNHDVGEIYFSKDGGSSWDKVYILDEKNLDKDGIKHAWFTNGVEVEKKYLVNNFKMKFVLDTGSDTEPAQSGGWYIDDVTINTKKSDISINKDNYEPFSLLNLERASEENTMPKSVIPVVGKVTIKETGISVMSEPGTGEFLIKHPVGEFTVIASSEGYKDKKEFNVQITKDETNKDIYLDEAKKARITVNVQSSEIDEYGSNKEIDGNVKLYKDASLKPIAEKDGKTVVFENIIPGRYTVRANKEGYKFAEKTFDLGEFGRTTSLELTKMFVGAKKSVGYTDKNAGELAGMDLKDRAFANKITNDKLVQINEVSYFVTKMKNVDLKGSKYRISIYDKNNADELPGKILFTKDLEFTKEGWNTLEIPKVVVDGNYYVAFTKLDGEIALGMDDNKPNECSVQMFNEAWDVPDTKGTYMICAKVQEYTDKEMFVVSFDPNGGKGTMDDVSVEKGNYTIPECKFIAPEGQEFDSWKVKGPDGAFYDVEKRPNETQYVFESITLVPQWKKVKSENNDKLEPIMPNPLMGSTNINDYKHLINYKEDAGEYLNTIEKVIVTHNDKIKEINDVKGVDGNSIKQLQFPFDSKLDENDTITIVSSKYKTVVVTIKSATLAGNDVYYALAANVEGVVTKRIIHFDKNGGSGEMADVEVNNGDIYSLPPCTFTPPEGQEFDCWEYLGDRAEVGHKYQINADVNVKALWKKKATEEFTISFDAGDGKSEMPSETKLKNEKFIVPECKFIAPEGKEFDCWILNDNEVVPGEEIEVVKDITLKAKWIEKIDEKDLKEPKGPILTEIKSDDSSYTKADCKQTIPYETSDSEYVDNIRKITIKKGGKEYRFYKFNTESGKETLTNRDMINLVFHNKFFYGRDDEIVISARGYKDLRIHIVEADDMVMNANYTAEVVANVKFETFGGSVVPEQIAKTTATWVEGVKKPEPDPTRVGFEFKGWYKDEKCTEEFDFSSKVIVDTTIYAKWQEATPEFTIKFEPGQGSGTMDDEYAEKGKLYTFPECTFKAPDGKEFKTWKIKGKDGFFSGITRDANEKTFVTEDITAVAEWKKLKKVEPAETFTIKFDANKGTGTMEDVVVPKGKYKVPECTFTPPAGKVFDGWKCGIKKLAVGAEIDIFQNETLKAIWKDANAPKVTIKFESNGGSGTMADGEVQQGQEYVLPKCTFTPPAGYEFSHWKYLISDLKPGDKIRPAGKVVTIKAMWKELTKPAPAPKKKFTITFNAGDGKGEMSSVEKEEGESYILPLPTFAAPEGKEFNGWILNEEIKNDGDEIVVNENITLTASWKEIPKKKFTIKFASNGGSGNMSNVELREGDRFTIPRCAFVAPENKEFSSWIVNDGEIKNVGDVVEVKGNITLKALWKEKEAPTPVPKPNPTPKPDSIPEWHNSPSIIPDFDFSYNNGKAFEDKSDSTIKKVENKPVVKENNKQVEPEVKDYEKHWGKDAIDFCMNNNYFDEIAIKSAFTPDKKASRAEFVTVLARFVDVREFENKHIFKDVDSNAFYSKFVEWAAENKIVNGTGNNLFEPEKEITRAEMATVLYRLVKFLKLDLKKENKNIIFKDDALIPSWAKEAVRELVNAGIMHGNEDNTFNPLGNLTRAELANLVYNLKNYYK